MATAVEAPARPLAELVERARSGERDSFGELVELLWPQLVALARTVLAGDDEAEDLVQESLIQAWRRLDSLRDPDRFPAWVRRIVVRRCYAHLRRRPAPPPDEPVTLPDDALERIDMVRLLRRLAPRQRAVVYLTVVEGRTAREAAAVLGILPATARVHRHRALARLRRALEERR